MRLESLEPRLLLASDLWLTKITPTGPAGRPFDALEIQFSKPIQGDSFTAADISIRVLGGNSIAPTEPTRLADDRYEVSFAGLTGSNTYVLTVGPDILGADDGLAMNQDRDATPGETGEDAYQAGLVSNVLSLADGDLRLDGKDLVFYGSNTSAINGAHEFRGVQVLAGARVNASEPGLTLAELQLDDGSTLALAGGSTLTVTGGIEVEGNSAIVCQGKNTGGRVDGQWAGVGVTIHAGSVSVDNGSKISADAQGYTTGQGPGGSGDYNVGGTYGGRGSNNTAAMYGDPFAPLDLGSAGGGAYGGWSAGGGAIRLIVETTLTLDGEITADGYSSAGGNNGGGAGGSVYIIAGSVTGSGRISADGYNGANGKGGGGRVAIHYANQMSVPQPNVTAANGGGGAEDGTVVIDNSRVFRFVEYADDLCHGRERIQWEAIGVPLAQVAADVIAYGDRVAYQIGTGLSAFAAADWDTMAVPDGAYELRATFHDTLGSVLGEASRTVLVNNAIGWHGGRIEADETWTAGRVHVVEDALRIGAGARVTVEPGAIVKFRKHIGITVENGGFLDALATQAQPIIFTSLADDTAGGDTNWDGSRTAPQPGDWTGVGVLGTGQFTTNGYVDMRYLTTTHSGTISPVEVWSGTQLHRITGDVVVPDLATLTINPGAVVKFDLGKGIYVQRGGTLLAQGSTALRITFTSIRDDSVGGDSNRDGNLTSPARGDWQSVFVDGGQATIGHAKFYYSGGGTDSTSLAGRRAQSGAVVTLANSFIAPRIRVWEERLTVARCLPTWGPSSLWRRPVPTWTWWSRRSPARPRRLPAPWRRLNGRLRTSAAGWRSARGTTRSTWWPIRIPRPSRSSPARSWWDRAWCWGRARRTRLRARSACRAMRRGFTAGR